MSTTRKRTAQPQPLPAKATATPSPASLSPSPSSPSSSSSSGQPSHGMSHADRAMAAMLRLAEERQSAEMADDEGDREDRRDSVVDRRSGVDRRDLLDLAGESNSAATASTNLERRRGPGRRRTDFMKCADEGEMTQEQFLFIMAIDAFKRVNGKTFPTWTDVLEVVRKLGYRKTMPSELNLGKNTEDWSEPANAPAGVFKEAEED
jgi:hypothetical protein